MNSCAEIPILNIYYMLCYAWDRLTAKDLVDVSQIEGDNIYNLFSRVLAKGISHLIKKGFHREYKLVHEVPVPLRGKINFNESLKKNSLRYGKLHCEFDELTHDVLHNQIIKATLHNLLKAEGIDKSIKSDLVNIYRYFYDVGDIRLNKRLFAKVTVNKHNARYEFILELCELLYDNMLIDEHSGTRTFRDFAREDGQMPYVFENFVRNFYKKHLTGYKTSRENIAWDAKGDGLCYLPIMQTDITLESSDRRILMDTKYYKQALKANMGQEKLNSGNLYQLYAYLKNSEGKTLKAGKSSVGILLYPQVGNALDLTYYMQGHALKICTVDLNVHWEEIQNRLIGIIANSENCDNAL